MVKSLLCNRNIDISNPAHDHAFIVTICAGSAYRHLFLDTKLQNHLIVKFPRFNEINLKSSTPQLSTGVAGKVDSR